VRDNDNIILENLYKSVIINENVNLDPWVEWFSKKEISNIPVSWSNVETDEGSMSYGGNVTYDNIMKNAKTNYSNYPDETLKKLSSELQDYVIGLQEDKKVIDQNTASGLISMFQDINNVKYFFNRYQGNDKSTPDKESTSTNEPIGKAIIGKSSEEASLLIKKELADYINRVESEEDKRKIIGYLNQTTPFELDPNNDNFPRDPELQKLLMGSNLSKDSVRHLMTPQQKQEFDKRYTLSQEYRRLSGHSPDRNMPTDEIEKIVNDMKRIKL
jgi:hypothetical protein